jgi:hypothetical protein
VAYEDAEDKRQALWLMQKFQLQRTGYLNENQKSLLRVSLDYSSDSQYKNRFYDRFDDSAWMEHAFVSAAEKIR